MLSERKLGLHLAWALLNEVQSRGVNLTLQGGLQYGALFLCGQLMAMPNKIGI